MKTRAPQGGIVVIPLSLAFWDCQVLRKSSLLFKNFHNSSGFFFSRCIVIIMIIILSAFNRRLRRNSPHLHEEYIRERTRRRHASSLRIFVCYFSFNVCCQSWAALYHCVIDVARVGGGEEGDVEGGNWNKSRMEINILYKHTKKKKKTQQKEFAGPANRSVQAAYDNRSRSSTTCSSSVLVSVGLLRRWREMPFFSAVAHWGDALREGRSLFLFLLFIFLFSRVSQFLFKHFFTPYQDITNCSASFNAQSRAL